MLLTIFFYLNTIECVLLLDRIASVRIMPRITSLLKVNPWFISLILFLFCNLVQLPSYFYFSPRTSQEYAQAQRESLQYLSNFTFCFREPFYTSEISPFLTISATLVRDILMIFIESSLAFYSIYAFKSYLSDLRGSNSSHVFNRLEMFNIGLSKMSLLLSSISIMAHILVTASVLSVSNNNIILSRFLTCFATIFASLKYISNFLLFYHFNQSFHDFFRPNYQNREIRLTHLGL